MLKFKDADEVRNCGYTEFVAKVNQTNVMPGAYSTLNQWINFSNITRESHVLEVASTTGFSSREIAKQTGCKSHGIDICSLSVERANRNADEEKVASRVTYSVDNVLEIDSGEYTHVIIGAALGFFPDPKVAMDRIASVLTKDGYILACCFYVNGTPMPEDVIKQREDMFGISNPPQTYQESRADFEGFKHVYYNHYDLHSEDEESIANYVKNTVKRYSEQQGDQREDVLMEIYNRLLDIKVFSNKLRKYYGYTVDVYQKNEQPRYVEQF